MLSKSATKISKKRGGILHVFTKAIKELKVLNTETKTEIARSESIIKKYGTERAALQLEQVAIDKTIEKMESVVGSDETKKVKITQD